MPAPLLASLCGSDDLRQVIVTRLGKRFPDGMKFFDGI
jgi:hypothetical protein